MALRQFSAKWSKNGSDPILVGFSTTGFEGNAEQARVQYETNHPGVTLTDVSDEGELSDAEAARIRAAIESSKRPVDPKRPA